ncbi:MATE family efflux transporter [Clostridium sp.]|uniref:MATE family efflux transporter n=1 Tax=Clostridium sp. TaxID=1506 RepID=UPI002FC66897
MKKVDLTEGNVLKVIVNLALPLAASSLLQFMYNFIDMMWVGGLGSDAVASIGSSSFYINVGYAINAMVVVGAGVVVSQAIGAKDYDRANKYINTAIVLNLVIGLIYSLCISIFSRDLIGFLGINNPEVERDALSYLLINGWGMVIIFFNSLCTRFFSSFGNNKISLIINSVGLIINIILDPIFIYGLDLGVNGAALATVLSNGVALIMAIIYSRGLYPLKPIKLFQFSMIKDIAKIGSPNAMQRIIFTMINIFLAKIIAVYGAEAIAAHKIGLQVESITFVIIGGFNGAIASYVGQNYGGKKCERISEGYSVSLKLGMGYASVVMALLLIIPEQLAGIFVSDPATIKITADYLRIIGLSQVFAAVEMVTGGAFMGLSRTKYSAAISVGLTVIRLPIAMILVKFIGVNGIWWSIAISSILKGVVSYVIYKYVLWKKVCKELKCAC